MSRQNGRTFSAEMPAGTTKKNGTDKADNDYRALSERTEKIKRTFRPLFQHINLIGSEQVEVRKKRTQSSE